MKTIDQAQRQTSRAIWIGRVLTSLAVLFMAVDGITKVMRVPQVVQATTIQLGFPESSIVRIGLLLLGFTVLYVVPPTAALGALLLTAYFGAATAANLRVGDPLFETIFPVLFALLIWVGLIMRDERLRVLLPMQR